MLRKLTRVLFVGGLVGVLAAAGLAAPAGAAPRKGATEDVGILASCGAAGYACFWVNANFGGTRGRVAGNNSNYLNLSNSSGCTAYRGTWNDCISSIRNDGTQCTVYFWTDAGYRGRYHSLSRGDQVANFGAAPPAGYGDPAFNDTISSNHWCTPR